MRGFICRSAGHHIFDPVRQGDAHSASKEPSRSASSRVIDNATIEAYNSDSKHRIRRTPHMSDSPVTTHPTLDPTAPAAGRGARGRGRSRRRAEGRAGPAGQPDRAHRPRHVATHSSPRRSTSCSRTRAATPCSRPPRRSTWRSGSSAATCTPRNCSSTPTCASSPPTRGATRTRACRSATSSRRACSA